MLFSVLYGRETCCFYQRKEHRLRVFETRVPRKICETKGDEVDIT